MCAMLQSLSGHQDPTSGAFLPLGGGIPGLQPTGLESLFDMYNQTEENVVRRELQQNTSFVENLLPPAWENIGNGATPSLDPGLPDWAHVSADTHIWTLNSCVGAFCVMGTN
jgi:hypothetical protein